VAIRCPSGAATASARRGLVHRLRKEAAIMYGYGFGGLLVLVLLILLLTGRL
jgi:hypothetical protein